MTANDIIRDFIKNIFMEKPNNLVFPNTYIGKFEADLIEITRSGYAYEYEVKISRSDFKADANKHFTVGYFEKTTHLKSEQTKGGTRVNHFYYVVPRDLLTADDVPAFAGLIYANQHETRRMSFHIIKKAPKLSKDKLGDNIKQKCFLSSYYKFHKLLKTKNNKKNENYEQ